MSRLGYNVYCKPNGAIVVEHIDDGEDNDPCEYVSFKTYCNKWKQDYPHLKVSRPVEDICQYCYVFAHRHRYLANHVSSTDTCIEVDADGDAVTVLRTMGDAFGVDNDGNDISCADVPQAGEGGGSSVPIDEPECATTSVAEERELLLLEAASHVSMARAQRKLYQDKMDVAKEHARLNTEHSERTYTFVVDYGQNMELPVYNANQPGCTYYFSPLSVYNLGMVDHAHKYANGEVSEHMYAHVYHEGVGKKGANNVASLVVKTLTRLNLLREDSVGELNIIFDNCSGQNKNNTVLKLAAWLKAMGYFRRVNFIFLVVGHTKNAADRLFNSLKHEYRKQDIFTMEVLIEKLSASDCVTVIPTVPDDFFNYDKLFKELYRPLASKVKQNHIFACIDDDQMNLRESNLDQHTATKFRLSKKGLLMNQTQLREHTSKELMMLECAGLNPYKMVELWKNYRPHVDPIYWDNILFREPEEKVMALVKAERGERLVFRAKIKDAKASGMKERLDSIALDIIDEGGDNEGDGMGDLAEKVGQQ
jgi:hypothetical protein